MATANIQDARLRSIQLPGDQIVLFGLFGDSNAIGFDTSGTDWTARAPDLPADGIVAGMGIWNKWTVGADAARSSDADTGTDFYSQGDCGLLDHGASTYLGTGQAAQSNGPENGLGYYARMSLVADSYRAGATAPNPFLGIVKYGVAGSVVHDAPANPAAGWHPTGGATGAFNILTTRYLRPAIDQAITDYGEGNVWYGGSVAIIGGTDAIDPGGVLTDVGDAEAVAGNAQAVIQGIHDFIGIRQAPTVLVIPPKAYEGGTSNSGYPNMELVQRELRALAKRRDAAGCRTVALELADSERISDYLHYSNYGQWINGRVMARAFASMGWRLERILEVP